MWCDTCIVTTCDTCPALHSLPTLARLGIEAAEAERLTSVLQNNTFRRDTARWGHVLSDTCTVTCPDTGACAPPWPCSTTAVTPTAACTGRGPGTGADTRGSCDGLHVARGRFVLETRRPVARGEELTITYCCPSLGTAARQAKLLATKGFR